MSGIGDFFSGTWDQITGGLGNLIFEGGKSENGLNMELLMPLLLTGIGQSQGWFSSDPPKIGYQGKVEREKAVNRQVPQDYNYPDRMPGEYGLRYFTDTQFAPHGDGDAIQAAADKVNAQSSQIRQDNRAQSDNIAPLIDRMKSGYSQYSKPLFANGGIVDALQNLRQGPMQQQQRSPMPQMPPQAQAQRPPMPPQSQRPPMPQMPPQAKGNAYGRLMQGPGDGLSDSIPANINGQQPAALGDGEFVVPADAVSHLGNGSTNAGAQQLQSMIDRVRQARTGQPQQGRQINANRYMPR